MVKFGDVFTQIEKENMIEVKFTKEDQEFIDNHYKKLDELIMEANRLYGKAR